MKSISIFASLFLFLSDALAGLPSGWTDDFEAARQRAGAGGRNVLLVFSGSDWCGWCKKFDKDTLAKPDFVRAASKKYELVMIDSPRDKSVLSAKAKTRNPKLVARYGICGYPSYVLTDAQGKEIARASGYVKGSFACPRGWRKSSNWTVATGSFGCSPRRRRAWVACSTSCAR